MGSEFLEQQNRRIEKYEESLRFYMNDVACNDTYKEMYFEVLGEIIKDQREVLDFINGYSDENEE